MTDREHESLMRMTKEQRLYWYRVGREQAEKGLDEPEHGRASKEEEKCWWAGWHSYAAMLPALPTDEPSERLRDSGGPVWIDDEEGNIHRISPWPHCEKCQKRMIQVAHDTWEYNCEHGTPQKSGGDQ